LKLLLDEMYAAAVAEQLRRRDHDVIAVAERADLRGSTDEDLLAWARIEDRALVTDNQRREPTLRIVPAVAVLDRARGRP
jgi:predicted nuclease of predicted toxin-antitoxin system